MFSMREAFTVGIVLTAKDMYSSVMSKAQRDIDILAKTSQAQADKFTRSLATWQKVGGIGVAMTMVGAEVSKFWEDAVATAGRNQANIDRVMIQMGDSSELMRSRVSKSFHEIKTVWGFTDDAISESLKELSGRLGSNNSALQAINSVSAFARARNIDLGESARMLTTIYNQYGSQMDSNLSIDEKYTISANKMDYVLKKLGGDWESIYMFLGNAGLKAKASGQGLDELLAIVSALGTEGARLRTSGASMISMLDDMTKIRKQQGWQEFFPSFKKSGNLVDMIGDLRKAYSDKGWMAPGIENQQKVIDSLTKHFGANAEMVYLFMQKFDIIKQSTQDLKDLSKETGALSPIMQKANANMETWDGTVQRIHAHLEELKETLGRGSIPIIKYFNEQLGHTIELLSTHKTAAGIVGGAATGVGLSSEVAKFVGPLVTTYATYRMWRILSNLKTAINLTSAANASTVAIDAEAGAVTGLKVASIGALSALGLFGEVILVIGAALTGWKIGQQLRKIKGLDEAIQRYFAWAGGVTIDTPEWSKKQKASFETGMKLSRGIPVTGPERSSYIKTQWENVSKSGFADYGQFIQMMARLGIKPLETQQALGKHYSSLPETKTKTPARLGALPVEKFQSGGYVPHDTLGFLHSGEYVFPKNRVQSLTPKFQSPITFNGGININMTSSGSSMLDAHNLARLVLNEINKSLKFDSKRFA